MGPAKQRFAPSRDRFLASACRAGRPPNQGSARQWRATAIISCAFNWSLTLLVGNPGERVAPNPRTDRQLLDGYRAQGSGGEVSSSGAPARLRDRSLRDR